MAGFKKAALLSASSDNLRLTRLLASHYYDVNSIFYQRRLSGRRRHEAAGVCRGDGLSLTEQTWTGYRQKSRPRDTWSSTAIFINRPGKIPGSNRSKWSPAPPPYHDWNARITAECYRPNGVARVYDGQGRILDIVNNYQHLSFNFGPTLIGWLQDQAPDTYARILEADAQSLAALGHGNAIAQAYNHAILPLATPRDRETQVVWGLKDFEHRFRRPAAAMWLPETAVNYPTLATLVDHGMKFVILSPYQAKRVRPLTGGEWTPAPQGPGYHPGLPLLFARRRQRLPEAAPHRRLFL